MRRRTFIKGTAATVVALPVLSSCGNDVSPPPYIDAAVDDDPNSAHYGMVPIVVGKYPEISAAGTALTVRLKQLSALGKRPFLVPEKGLLLVRLPDEAVAASDDPSNPFFASDSACPHAGCPLGFNATAGLIECPCHSSRFRAFPDPAVPRSCGGQVVHRPAQSDLRTYATSYEAFSDTVYVDLKQILTCNQLPAAVGGVVSVTLDMVPALMTVGGSYVATPKGFGDALVLVRASDTEVVTLSAVCTHRHCTVGFSEADNLIRCPCHGSRFDLQGKVVKGPAELPLTEYATTFDGTTIQITVA